MNRQQIIEAIADLPAKERMTLIRDLQQAAATDADRFSSGKSDDNAAYKQIIERDQAQVQQQTAEQTYAQTAAKAITPQSVKKETQSMTGTTTQLASGTNPVPPGHVPDANNSGSNSDEKKPGDNLKEANREQGVSEGAAPGANAQHS